MEPEITTGQAATGTKYYVKFLLPKDVALHPQFLHDLEDFLVGWLHKNG